MPIISWSCASEWSDEEVVGDVATYKSDEPIPSVI
jgi:hypothetical protein